MEKVFDIHVHFLFYIPMAETVEIFKEEFSETGTEKYAFLSIPHESNGKELYFSPDQNVKALFLKQTFSPNAYAFAGLNHPQENVGDEERAENYYSQAVQYYNAGFDGIKMLEGHPKLRKAMKISLNSPVYDKFYSYLEGVGMPLIMHVADPAESWSLETATESAKALGRTYVDNFPTKKQLTDEVFGILKKHPRLKLGLAHLGFLTYDITEAEKFFSYDNTFLDVTPGGQSLINMSEKWEIWLPFFEKHQNRIIYGSDFYAFPKKNLAEWRSSFKRRPDFLRCFFETDTDFVYDGKTVHGVKLSKNLRDKLYRDNFTSLLGSPRSIDTDYFKKELDRLLKTPLTGNVYYTKDGVIDISSPEAFEKVTERYKNDLRYMLENFNRLQ